MGFVDIFLVIGLGLLLAQVLRLRARVSDLERRVAVPPRDGAPTPGRVWTAPGSPQIVPGARVPPPPPPSASGAWSLSPSRGGTWDRLFSGRLLIWVGGAALALGGLFLVSYSIEVGLIGPGVRMALAAALGLAFLGAGEWGRARMADEPRVAQALVGAGVLVLYATAYAAHRLYDFYGVGAAFAVLALVAAGGVALSLRHGWPAAALGLVGGLATPALVGDVGAVAPLLGYLLALNAAVLLAARARKWGALLGAAVLGTAGWIVPLSASAEGGETWAVGSFALAYALAASFTLDRTPPGARHAWLTAASLPAALGLAQLAALLVAQRLFAPGWLFYAALAGAVIWRDRAGRVPWLPLGAATGAVGLLCLQQAMDRLGLAFEGARLAGVVSPWLVGAGILLLFAPAAALRVADRPLWTGVFAVATIGPALALRAGATGMDLTRSAWGLLLLGLALLAAALAWRVPGEGDGRRAGLFATAALLAGVGAADLFTPVWTPAAWALLALALAGGAGRLDDKGAARVATFVAGAALLGSLAWLGRAPAWPDAGQATALLAVPGALLAGAALLTREVGARRWLWAGAGLAGLAWAGVLARQLSGLSRVLSFLALGAALVAAGRVWGRRRGTPL